MITPQGERLNLELYRAEHVMASPVVTLRKTERVSVVARALVDTSHGGFPVLGKDSDPEAFAGVITRAELLIILIKYNAGGRQVSSEFVCGIARTYF